MARATMSRLGLVVMTVVAVATSVAGLKLPSYIKGCSLSDPSLNECAASSARKALSDIVKGDKKYKVPNLNPLHVDKLVIDVGESLQMTFSNVSVIGLDDIIVNSMIIDAAKKQWTIMADIPLLELILTYDIRGRILIVPIVGSGPGNMSIEHPNFKYTFNYELFKKKELEHMKIKDHKVEMAPERVYWELVNLFNGDPRLGPEMNRFLNENWSDVMKEIGPGIADTISTIITSVIASYINKVPFSDMFSP